MADTCGYQDTGSKSHMVNGCPDIGRNDRGVGFGLRDTGVDKNDGNPIAPAGCYPRPGRPPSRLGVFVIQQGGRWPRSRIIATAFLSGGSSFIYYLKSSILVRKILWSANSGHYNPTFQASGRSAKEDISSWVGASFFAGNLMVNKVYAPSTL